MTEAIATALPADASRGASAQAIEAHYDVSNDFYSLWLDRTMVYSCAFWEEDDTLELAQRRKLDFHLAQASATGKSNLLDIGCGWGALLDHAVANRGIGKATGLTLSKAQAEWVRASKRESVCVLLESWEDHKPSAPYDAIVSIGAFEHFAKAGLTKAAKADAYRNFFRWCHRNSTPDCDLSLQSIVYENYDEESPNPFVEEIFPESDLPRASEILTACDGLFEVVSLRNDRAHYARTLQCWYANLRKNRCERRSGSALIRR